MKELSIFVALMAFALAAMGLPGWGWFLAAAVAFAVFG